MPGPCRRCLVPSTGAMEVQEEPSEHRSPSSWRSRLAPPKQHCDPGRAGDGTGWAWCWRGHLCQLGCQHTSHSRHHPLRDAQSPGRSTAGSSSAVQPAPRAPLSPGISKRPEPGWCPSPRGSFWHRTPRALLPGGDLITTTRPGRAAGPPGSKHLPPPAPALGTTRWDSSPHPSAHSGAPLRLRHRPRGFRELRPAGTWLRPNVTLALSSPAGQTPGAPPAPRWKPPLPRPQAPDSPSEAGTGCGTGAGQEVTPDPPPQPHAKEGQRRGRRRQPWGEERGADAG